MALQCIYRVAREYIVSVKLQITIFSNRILKVLIGCVVLVPVVICTARIGGIFGVQFSVEVSVRVTVIASGASVFFRTAGVPVAFRILGSVAADIDSRVTREGAAVGILGTGRLLQQPIAAGGNPNIVVVLTACGYKDWQMFIMAYILSSIVVIQPFNLRLCLLHMYRK